MSTETDAEIVATCEAAASYLDRYGLWRGGFVHQATQKACAAGALVISNGGADTLRYGGGAAIERALHSCQAIPAVAETILARYPQRLLDRPEVYAGHDGKACAIFNFNDHKDTTQADVIEVLRETIKRHTPDEYTSTPGEGS